jgi:hypothetical protein
VTLSQREAQIVADLLYEEAVRKPHGYEELMTLRDRFKTACGWPDRRRGDRRRETSTKR